jgi:hypothetical protein
LSGTPTATVTGAAATTTGAGAATSTGWNATLPSGSTTQPDTTNNPPASMHPMPALTNFVFIDYLFLLLSLWIPRFAQGRADLSNNHHAVLFSNDSANLASGRTGSSKAIQAERENE